MSDQEVIMFDDPRAAHKETVELWVSRRGIMFQSEDDARRDGMTTRRCDRCGQLTERKHHAFCKICRDQNDRERWIAFEAVEWDGKTPLCLYRDDVYLYDEDALIEYLDESENPELAMFVLCKPHKPREFDAGDLFDDYIPQDMGTEALPKAVLDAVEALNKAVVESFTWCWIADHKRINIDKYIKEIGRREEELK